MFRFTKIMANLVGTTSRRLLCSVFKSLTLGQPQFPQKWNIGTLLYFQWLTDTHNGTLWNITLLTTIQHYL